MTDKLTPQEAAEQLSIPDEDVDAFVGMIDALRSARTRGAEDDQRRTELDSLDGHD